MSQVLSAAVLGACALCLQPAAARSISSNTSGGPLGDPDGNTPGQLPACEPTFAASSIKPFDCLDYGSKGPGAVPVSWAQATLQFMLDLAAFNAQTQTNNALFADPNFRSPTEVHRESNLGAGSDNDLFDVQLDALTQKGTLVLLRDLDSEFMLGLSGELHPSAAYTYFHPGETEFYAWFFFSGHHLAGESFTIEMPMVQEMTGALLKSVDLFSVAEPQGGGRPVPLPASLWLSLLGLAALKGVRRATPGR